MERLVWSVNTTKLDFANSETDVEKDIIMKYVKTKTNVKKNGVPKDIQKDAETSLNSESAGQQKLCLPTLCPGTQI